MNNTKRNFQYDLIRVIAMIMVLIIHVEEETRYFKHPHNIPWHISTILIAFLIICNPIFFMMSGKFNLKKNFQSPHDYYTYYKKKVITIIIPFVIFSIFIFIWDNHGSFRIKSFLWNFLSGDIEGTYWFLYYLTGLLFVTPFLSKINNSMQLFEKKFFLFLFIGLDFLIFIANNINKNNLFNENVFVFLNWCFFFFSGSIVEDVFQSKKSRKIIIFFGSFSFIIRILLTKYLNNYIITAIDPFMIFQAFAFLFICLDYININSITNYISCLAQHSFTFYLIHHFFIKIIGSFFNFQISYSLNIIYGLILLIISFFVSFSFSVIIDKYILLPIQSKFLK